MKRSWLVLALAVAAVAVVGAVKLWRPPVVRLADVTVRDVAPGVQAVGTVEAKLVVGVGAVVGGRIVALHADQGDVVRAGQVLVELDDVQLAADARRAAAVLETITAQLRDLRAGARPEEIAEARANVERARAELDDVVAGARRQEIEEQEERVRGAAATRVLAERELRRVRLLHARELLAMQDVDRAEQAHDVAIAQERAAQHALDMAREGPRPHLAARARAQLAAAEHHLALVLAGPRPDQVATLDAQRREAEAALAAARRRHADARTASPFDGVVVSRELELGAVVTPGTTILKIADLRTAWVTVHVDERETAAITRGDPAEVTLRSSPAKTLAGRVARIRRESDRVTEQLAVDITLDRLPERLTLGEQATATVRPAPHRGVAAVPLAALVRRPEGPGVLTVVDGRLAFRPVRLGMTDPDGWAEILGGLTPGDQVVVAPGRLADPNHEGRSIRVARAGAEAAAAR